MNTVISLFKNEVVVQEGNNYLYFDKQNIPTELPQISQMSFLWVMLMKNIIGI